jgi:hypothetical protein
MCPVKKRSTSSKKPEKSPKPQAFSPELQFEPTKEMLEQTVKNANCILDNNKTIQDFEYKVLLLSSIKPSQSGEDRFNDSSIEAARILREWNEGKVKNDNIGYWNDFRPIVIDKNRNIIDGNHRYTAHEINGWKYIRVLQVKEKR